MSTRYVPGSAAILVGDRGLVATARENADGLIALAGTDLVVLTVIDSLSHGSLANLPDFACVVVDGADLRIVVRGGFVARVAGQSWSGEGVATWREHTVAGGAGSDVVIETAEVEDGPELPVSSGIVLASRATWSSVAAPAPEPVEPQPETYVESEAVPPAPVAPPSFPPPSFPPPSFPPPAPPAQRTIDPEVTVTESDLALDTMFGATILGRQPEEEPELPGDHDGRTITAAQLRALREQAAVAQEEPLQAAVILPDGERHAVAPRLLIGRRPQARQVATADVPTLVTVNDPYVSSTHVEAAVVDGRFVVTDLSTNGTLVTRPGEAPEQLVKGAPTEVVDGTRLSLSDELVVTVELRTGG